MSPSATTAPLHGLRVLDFGRYLSAPMAGVFLADQGADVIRVARPDAPQWDASAEQALARGKRTLQLDLKTAEGRARALELAAGCDVVLENFRPGVMDRLGLGYDVVSELAPQVVYVSMPGYSRHDPRAGERAWDSTVSAATGLFSGSSIAGAALDLAPTYTQLPLPSAYAGVWAAIAAVSGVYGRQQHGQGDHIEVSLTDAAMSSAAGVTFVVENQPPRYNSPQLPRQIIDRISLGFLPDRLNEALHKATPGQMPPLFRNYKCRDGGLLLICMIDNANQLDKLLDVTGLREKVLALGFEEGDIFDEPATPNNIYAYRGPSKYWTGLRKLLEELFATDDAAVWADRLMRAGVPAVRQSTTADWTSIPEMIHSGVVLKAVDADGNAVTQPAPQIDVVGRGVQTSPSPQPAPESASVDWRHEPTFVAPPAVDDAAIGSPLAGVQVVDLANVIAGPSVGRTLAELGAEVLHVSAVQPKMGPRQTVLYGIEVNQGKRDIGLDLHRPEGQDVLRRLLPQADVVLYNKRADQAAKLTAAPEQVHAINPGIVVTAVTAFSGVNPGGWEDRPGYDPIIQALSGIMRRYGGNAMPQVHGIASCVDYFTGFSGAFGTVVALLARTRGATHLVTRTSLARSAAWVQLPLLNEGHDTAPTHGMLERGQHPLNRLYRARGGWIHVTAPVHEWPAIRAAAGHDAPSRPECAGEWLTARIARKPAAEAVAWANSIGCTAVTVPSISDLRRHAVPGRPEGDLIAPDLPSGRLLLAEHPDERFYVPDALWVRPSGGRPQLRPAPRPGQDTREVLAELGYDPQTISSMLATGAATESWFAGPRYLPA